MIICDAINGFIAKETKNGIELSLPTRLPMYSDISAVPPQISVMCNGKEQLAVGHWYRTKVGENGSFMVCDWLY